MWSKSLKVLRSNKGIMMNAILLIKNNGNEVLFEDLFVHWVRTAFKAKKDKEAINELFNWSERLAEEGRETQKKFLNFCLEIFRQAMLKNFNAEPLIYFQSHDGKFSFDKFSEYIHHNNILEIKEEIEKAIFHIERNGNAKIIFTDVSIRLTRLIHRKQNL